MIKTEVKETRVPSFADIPAVKAAQQAKRDQKEADLYPRDGSRELFQLEKDIADLLGIKKGNLLVYNTAAVAAIDALEISRPSAGTVILKGARNYSQAGDYIANELCSRGAEVLTANLTSLYEINNLLADKKPALVFFETGENGFKLQTQDVERFLLLPALAELDPVVILDNTLATNADTDLNRIIAASERKIIGIENGLKLTGSRGEEFGIAYTYNPDLLLLLRKRRQRTGSLLSASAVIAANHNLFTTETECDDGVEDKAGLLKLEKDIATMLGVRPGNLLLYNTGMSAVVDALEINRPTNGTLILKGRQHYSQADNYIKDELHSRGVNVLEADPGSIKYVNEVLETKKPGIIFFETVTNGSEMATLNVKEFLSLPALQDLDPLIILDNTLPTSTGVALDPILSDSDRKVIGIESGTKFIGLNTEMCGIAYTYNPDLLLLLRKRRQRGSLLSASAAETIRDCMPKTARDYNARNSAIFRHTLRLARACCGEGDNGLVVAHPNLPSHPSSEYANSYCPDGISPVFFIQPELGEDHYQIANVLWKNPVITKLCDLGQSFGFNRARIWPDDNGNYVRISGGIYSENEQAALDKAFKEVLSAWS